MRRVTSKSVLLKKQKNKAVRREISTTPNATMTGSLYSAIKAKSGRARVCVIRSVGGIGDVLMTTPTLRQLKREFPEIHLTYAIDMHRGGNIYFDLVHNAPFIDHVMDARYVNRGAYDSVVDISAVCIRYERRGLPAINRIDLFARACGMNRVRNKLPFFNLEPAEIANASRVVSGFRKNGKQLVALHTASFEGKRSWTAGHYHKLIRVTKQRNPDIHFVVFDFNGVLGPLTKYDNCLDASQLSIREKAALIGQSDLFIGPDSGLMHIAGALQKQSLIIFGSIPPEARINYYKSHEAITHSGVSCLGCWYEACPIQVRCMTDLNHIVVYDRMIKKLGA